MKNLTDVMRTDFIGERETKRKEKVQMIAREEEGRKKLLQRRESSRLSQVERLSMNRRLKKKVYEY